MEVVLFFAVIKKESRHEILNNFKNCLHNCKNYEPLLYHQGQGEECSWDVQHNVVILQCCQMKSKWSEVHYFFSRLQFV